MNQIGFSCFLVHGQVTNFEFLLAILHIYHSTYQINTYFILWQIFLAVSSRIDQYYRKVWYENIIYKPFAFWWDISSTTDTSACAARKPRGSSRCTWPRGRTSWAGLAEFRAHLLCRPTHVLLKISQHFLICEQTFCVALLLLI